MLRARSGVATTTRQYARSAAAAAASPRARAAAAASARAPNQWLPMTTATPVGVEHGRANELSDSAASGTTPRPHVRSMSRRTPSSSRSSPRPRPSWPRCPRRRWPAHLAHEFAKTVPADGTPLQRRRSARAPSPSTSGLCHSNNATRTLRVRGAVRARRDRVRGATASLLNASPRRGARRAARRRKRDRRRRRATRAGDGAHLRARERREVEPPRRHMNMRHRRRAGSSRPPGRRPRGARAWERDPSRPPSPPRVHERR